MQFQVLGILVAVGCGASPRPPPANVAPTDSELYCPSPTAVQPLSPQASLPLNDGGYRRLGDDVAVQTFRAAVMAPNIATPQQISAMGEGKLEPALTAAIMDLRPELDECMRADPIVPNLQYSLRVHVFGSAIDGSYATSVEFLRIDGTKTRAAPCVEALFSRLALPPSMGWSEMLTIVRYDNCTPKPYLAKADVQQYASKAYPAWVVAHPGQVCPNRLEDLSGYMGARGAGIDPWGRPYKMMCGATLPPGATGIAVMSLGSDGKPGTDDDIESWDTQEIMKGDLARLRPQ